MNYQFTDFIKVALGNKKEMIIAPTEEEWQHLMDECLRQSIIGIGWEGLEKLPKHQRPNRRITGQWYMLSMELERHTQEAERKAAMVEQTLRNDGIECCILKGQGVGRLYPNPYHRQSGDIDIWVSCGRKKAIAYARKKLGRENVEARIHHVEFPYFKNTKVEIHYWPMFMYSFSSQKRLQKFFKKEVKKQINTPAMPRPDLSDTQDFHCPGSEFNAIFMATHIMRHLFEEGIGLRQLIDYYYVLKSLPRNQDDSGIDENVKRHIMKTARYLRIDEFLKCIMYVMREALGMDEKYQLCEYDSDKGQTLLTEIMYTGNFGFYDTRTFSWKKSSKTRLFFGKFLHNMRLWRLSPREIIFGPSFRLWHHLWRKRHHYMS